MCDNLCDNQQVSAGGEGTSQDLHKVEWLKKKSTKILHSPWRWVGGGGTMIPDTVLQKKSYFSFSFCFLLKAEPETKIWEQVDLFESRSQILGWAGKANVRVYYQRFFCGQ